MVPKFKDGTLGQAITRLKSAMTQEATDLAKYIGPLPQLAANAAARKAIEDFTNTWIPQMTVMALR